MSSRDLRTSEAQDRTFKHELELWRAWRDGSPDYQRWRGWDHNYAVYGILAFAYEQGWISQQILSIVLAFMLEMFSLIPISIWASSPRFLTLDFALMTATASYLCYRLWSCSKLLFLSVVPILVTCASFTLLLWLS
jgi:hypothetical protein